MAYRRSSKKTGNNTKTTTTSTSGKGTRLTHSTKSGSGGIKRTYSWSWNKGGGMRRTVTDNINGLITRRTLPGAPKSRKSSGTRSRRRKGGSGDLFLLKLIWLLITLPFIILFKCRRIIWWFIKLPFVICFGILKLIFRR